MAKEIVFSLSLSHYSQYVRATAINTFIRENVTTNRYLVFGQLIGSFLQIVLSSKWL